jgi:purine-nucleoside phosphorylase
MSSIFDKATKAATLIKNKTDLQVQTFIVLGSGLGAFAESLDNAVTLSYSEIPHLPQATVIGHSGKLVIGRCQGVAVAVMAGRFHYYEGYSMEEVTFPIRIAGVAGFQNIIITNAAGGVNPNFQPGDFMIIEDHINLIGANPLRGANDERMGARFPDMSEVYNGSFRALAERAGLNMGLRMQRGVYAAVGGPSYETPAEIRMLRQLGADAVGMSTVPEAITARHMGMKVLGLSCISNLAAGLKKGELNHQEVLDTSANVSNKFVELLCRIVQQIESV